MKERWWLAEKARKVLGERVHLSVAGWMQATASGEVLSTDRDSAAVCLHPPDPDDPIPPALMVKWRAVRSERRWRWWLRASRERREARGLLAARACGIDAEEPLAVGERRDGWGRLLGSVLVRRFRTGWTAQEFLQDTGPAGLDLVAPGLRTWHDAGFRHGDAWPKNLLVTFGMTLIPIGAPKGFRTSSGPRLDRARLADLARFAAGLREIWPDGDPFAFLEIYGKAAPPLSRAEIEAGARPLLERVRAKRAEDERTRPQREPDGPPQPVPLSPDAAPLRRVERPLRHLD